MMSWSINMADSAAFVACRFVIRRVNRQTSRIGMMAAKGTSRSRGIRLRLLGAGRVLVDHRRKDSGLQPARKGGVVLLVSESQRDHLLHQRVLLGIGQTHPMLHAHPNIGHYVQGFLPQRLVLDCLCLGNQELHSGLNHGRSPAQCSRIGVPLSGNGLVLRRCWNTSQR